MRASRLKQVTENGQPFAAGATPTGSHRVAVSPMTAKQQQEFEFTLSKLAARSWFCAVDFADLDKEGLQLADLRREVQEYSSIPRHARKYVVRIVDHHMIVLASPAWQPMRKSAG